MENNRTFIIIGIAFIFCAFLIMVIVISPFSAKPGDDREKAGGEKPAQDIGSIESLPDVPGDCAKIGDAKLRENCFNRKKLSNILYGEKNIKSCLEFTDLSFRDDCLFRMAKKETDINYCQKIPGKRNRESCIQEVAIGNNNAKVCDVFSGEPYETRECKDRVKAANVGSEAKDTLPVNYCANIKTLEYGKLCVQNAIRSGKALTGETGNTGFEESWSAFILYRDASKEEDCRKISFKGGRLACLEKIKHPDYQYFDYDNDTINDDRELWFGIDPSKPDTDGDGLSDYEEMGNYGTDPVQPDTDSDGLSDYDEIRKHFSDPNKSDSDNDGIADGKAVESGKNPVSGDADHDGLADEDEARIGTKPGKPDTDSDGVSDGEEWNNGFDPLGSGQGLCDTDSDGVIDIDEIFYGTDRFKPDTDGDGMDDREEIDSLTDPCGSGDMDFDGDGLSDVKERDMGTNPAMRDSDEDGVSDFDELMNGGNATRNEALTR